MAKPIPQKKAVARKKRTGEIHDLMDVKNQRKMERKIDNYLMELDENSEGREAWVKLILEENDASITEIVDTMAEQLQKMQGIPKLYLDGHVIPVNEDEFRMLQKIQVRNFRWIAMRCLVACAEWGIKIGNFKAPKDKCLRCGKDA